MACEAEICMSRVGFIGGGNMSTAIFKGILKKGGFPVKNIWVSGPRLGSLEHWKELGANVTTNNSELLSQCELVFLGVKPGMLIDVVKSLQGMRTEKPKLFISMLAGVTLEKIRKVLQVHYQFGQENIKLVRIMPNIPMAVGSGACLYTCENNVQFQHRELIVKLLDSCGNSEEIPESLMDSLGVLTGCGPAYMFVIIEALADGAVKQGVPRAAAVRAAARVMLGSAALVLDSAKHPAQLKDEVCSPGGSTIAGVSVLEDGKLRATMINAIEASTNKMKELLSKVSI